MSYQEQLVGNQAYFIFALSIMLVFLVLAAPVRELDRSRGGRADRADGARRRSSRR